MNTDTNIDTNIDIAQGSKLADKQPEASLRVIVVEDEAIIRLDLQETLEAEGYDVVDTASDGKEALAKINELKPDLVILDIKIPEIDGLTVASEVSDFCAVVILTAFSQKDLVSNAIEVGAQAYLVKPFEQNALRAAVELGIVRFRQAQALKAETQKLSDRLESRKHIDKAKGVLMDRFHYTEADSFSFIQKEAMNSRVSMKSVALQVIDGKLPVVDS